jgi:PAS domain S-box-containing protein
MKTMTPIPTIKEQPDKGCCQAAELPFEETAEQCATYHALRDSEERYRIIADSCPSMMWASDMQGEILFLNRAGREYFGMSHEDVSDKNWHFLIHPDDAPVFIAAFNRSILEHTHFSAEARMRRADGQWRLLGMRAEPRLSESGNYLGHIGLCADITERIQAEQTRQFELSFMRAVQVETREGILVVNEAGAVVLHNDRFLEMWRLPDISASGQQPDKFVGVQDQPIVLSFLDRVKNPEPFLRRIKELDSHPDERDTCEVELKDGRTLERHSTGLRDQQGNYLGRVWFFRDITAQKQASINLQNAKEMVEYANHRLLSERSILEKERTMLRALIDNIPDFMYVKDVESRFIVSNSHLAHVLGAQSADELLGKTDFDFFPKEMAQGFYDDEQNVIRTGMPLYNRDEKSVNSAGKEVFILTTKVPLRDEKGHVVGIAGVGRDITERKKIEDDLREAEQKYRGIFDKAIIGIFQSTPEGRFLSVNPSMAFTFGYNSPEEMIASINDLSQQFYVSTQRRDEFMMFMEKLGAVQNFECEVYRKDGSKIWLVMSVRAIRQFGSVVRLEGMCEDITERNLLRGQLLQAQKLESVGQLAAGIAHEINTPTQYIGDNVRFLKDSFSDLKNLLTNYERLMAAAKSKSLSSAMIEEIGNAAQQTDTEFLLEEIPRAIDQTLEGVSRVAKLVSAMKEFSHPGTKEKVSQDLNHAIDNTITVARNEWKYVAEMETDFDPSLPLVACLPGEFNQVILNMIVNAAHAIADVIAKGGPAMGKIKIQTRSCAEWAEIRVSDTGTGIPEKVRPRIFDPFFTTKEIGKGTGQGLAIARSVIVDKHGGTIHFETEEGKGTTFVIRLPLNGTSLVAKAVAA